MNQMNKQFFPVVNLVSIFKTIGMLLICFWIIGFYAFNANSFIHVVLVAGLILFIPELLALREINKKKV